MKPYLYSLLLGLLSPALFADTAGPVNNIQVTLNSDLRELAAAYAQGFTQLSNNIYVAVQRDGQREVLGPVRSLKAVDGVLLVEVGRGSRYLINPRDLVFLTDDPSRAR